MLILSHRCVHSLVPCDPDLLKGGGDVLDQNAKQASYFVKQCINYKSKKRLQKSISICYKNVFCVCVLH